MQLAWTHLLPATFGGRARFNVANAMAAAAAAFAAGAPLHDIRQGLRTFTTSYYLSPGRLNEIEVEGVTVFVDYCHNAHGMRALGDFVDRLRADRDQGGPDMRHRCVAVVAAAGDRRDDDMRELGEVAAQHFDAIVVREDTSLRGRAPGETAALIVDGVKRAMADSGRARSVDVVLDEIEAVRAALTKANPGDIVVHCADKHGAVLAELEAVSRRAQAGARDQDR
jgi:cyanophycin synthetase